MPNNNDDRRGSTAVLGDRIRDARRSKNMTQGELAGNDYSVSYISAIERSKIRPSLRALAWLASRLGVQLSDLLAGSDMQSYGDLTSPIAAEEGDVQTALAQAQMAIADHQYREAYEQLTSIRDRVTLPSQRTQLDLVLGEAAIALNEGQEAKEVLEHNVLVNKDIDPNMQERSRNLLGLAYNRLAMHMLAAECHRQCLSAIDSGIIRDPSFELAVLNNLGHDYMQLGLYHEAIAVYERAAKVGRRLLSAHDVARFYWEISQQFRQDGMAPQAQRYADMAAEHLRTAGNRQIFAQVQSSLGLAQAELQQNDDAEHTLQQACELSERAGDDLGRSMALASLSRVQLSRGAKEEARLSAEEALRSAETSGDRDAQGRAYLAMGEALSALKEGAQADTFFARGLEQLERSGLQAELTRAYERYADLLEARGDVKKALVYLKKSRGGAAVSH